MDQAHAHVASAARVLVVGTSLTVQPAASLANHAPDYADRVLVSLEMEHVPPGYRFLHGPAAQRVPQIGMRWLDEGADRRVR